MIGNDHDPASRPEDFQCLVKTGGEAFELPVDLNANGLEHSCKGLHGRPGSHRATHHISKVSRGPQRPARSFLGQVAGNAPCLPFLPKPTDQRGQFVRAHAVEDLLRIQCLGPVHPHVQRFIGAEGESSPGRVELMRGHPEIEEDPVRFLHRTTAKNVVQHPEISMNGHETVSESAKMPRCLVQRICIGINADTSTVRAAPLEDRPRVPSSAKRRIHKGSTGGGGKQGKRLLEEDRRMVPACFHRSDIRP